MLKQRIVTAVVSLTILLLLLFAAPPLVTEIAIALMVIGGAWEWSGLLRADSIPVRATYTLAVALSLAAVWHWQADVAGWLYVVALAWWAAATVWVVIFPTAVPRAIALVGGFLILVPLFTALTALYHQGSERLLFLLLIVWSADIGAYFAGKQFGKLKLKPSISPGKTWEGVIGGLVFAGLIGTAGAAWFGDAYLALVPFCLAIAVISVIGDLTVSIFKRGAGVKDSGSLFPGHGGILDRIDSVSAASPLFMLGLAWLGLLQ